jgi:protoporphyrinogen oxidase
VNPTDDRRRPQVAIIGAGPAGLTAAYQLGKHGAPATVYEASDVVGGISRTEVRDGWRFDIGGHRFFTKVPEVEKLWYELLSDGDLLIRPRKSRIYFDGRYIDYPIRVTNALRQVGPVEATRCVISYLKARISPPADQSNYEGWLVARFGWRLYQLFFKTYTEKVWGVPVSAMPADWAAQRIKSLSLGRAVLSALSPRRRGEVTSLIEEFLYPRQGPGMMWEACRDAVVERGGTIRLSTPVTAIRCHGGRAVSIVATDPDGTKIEQPCTDVISSMPISALVAAIDPPCPDEVLTAAASLRYRDYLIVALVLRAEDVTFDDNWIYIHDPGVRAIRIQNFGAWSPDMVKPGRNTLGLEYTLWEGDDGWDTPDEVLVERAIEELAELGLADASEIEAGYVVRQRKAYPIYDDHYQANVAAIRSWLAANAANIHPVGRNGLFRYNNQDHSMLTAMLTVDNIVAGTDHDIWDINVDDDYHEEKQGVAETSRPSGSHGSGRDAPVIPRSVLDRRGS